MQILNQFKGAHRKVFSASSINWWTFYRLVLSLVYSAGKVRETLAVLEPLRIILPKNCRNETVEFFAFFI